MVRWLRFTRALQAGENFPRPLVNPAPSRILQTSVKNSSFEASFDPTEFAQLIRENVSDLIAVINSARQRVWFNDAYCTTLGFTRTELETGDSTAKLHPDDIAAVRQAFEDSMREGLGRSLEYRMSRRDGSWVWLESTGRVVRNVHGVGDCLVLVARDISQRKDREAMQRSTRRRLKLQKAALLGLLHEKVGVKEGWGEALRSLTSAAAETLGGASASVWWLRDHTFSREMEWRRLPEPVAGLEPAIRPADPAYLQALNAAPVFVVAEPTGAPAPATAGAALHVPLLRDGRLAGVLVIEDAEPMRSWHDDEQSFAESLGTLLVQWLEARERRLVLEQLHSELDEAASYVRALLPPPLVGTVRADSLFVSSTSLGGDAFGWRWIDPGHFAIYLLDVCGHGVGSALHSVSALNTLRSGALPGLDFRRPARVLAGMNRAFPMEQHHGLYFTLWYGVFSTSDRVLRFASAGHPPALLFAAGEVGAPVPLGKPAPVIGAWEEAVYQEESHPMDAGDCLCVFSDGVTEIERPDGTFWPEAEFIAALRAIVGPAAPLEGLTTILRDVGNREHLADDASMVRVWFS